MKVNLTKNSDVEVELNILVSSTDLEPLVKHVYDDLRPRVKAKGFRPGKAPDNVIERELGSETVQSEVIEHAINDFYRQALAQEELQPLEAPQITIKKFVPYSELEFAAVLEIVPPIKLPDYKKFKQTAATVKVTDEEVDKVIESLRQRLAKRQSVKRAAKEGDEVLIDFKGEKDGRVVPNTEAKNQPLLLGSGRFIPGFEDELIGLKVKDSKTFDIRFPKDYGEKSLANQVVTFTVRVNDIQELVLPDVDDKFAKEAGPFKDLDQLKEDIKRQIETEKQQDAARELENAVMTQIIEKTKFNLPPKMLEKQLQHRQADYERQLQARGTTLEDWLKEQGTTLSDWQKKELQADAERQVKAALILTAVAKNESLEITPDELEMRVQLLKGQYQDKAMQEELDKPGVRNEIANQMLAEKTINKLVEYATAK